MEPTWRDASRLRIDQTDLRSWRPSTNAQRMSWINCPFTPCDKTWPNPQTAVELAKHLRFRHRGLRLTQAQVLTYGFETCDLCDAPFVPGLGGLRRHRKNPCARARSMEGDVAISERSAGMVSGEAPVKSSAVQTLGTNCMDLGAFGRCMSVIKRPRPSSSGPVDDGASPGHLSPKRARDHSSDGTPWCAELSSAH